MDLHRKIILCRRTSVGAVVRHQQDETLNFDDLHGSALSLSLLAGGQSARAFSCSIVRWHRNITPPFSRQGGRSASQTAPICHGQRPAYTQPCPLRFGSPADGPPVRVSGSRSGTGTAWSKLWV